MQPPKILLVTIAFLSLWSVSRADDVAINRIGVDKDRLRIEHVSNIASYYILLGGDSVESIVTPQKLALGQNGPGAFSLTLTNNVSGFFVIEQVSKSAPLDLDADGIDDVYELEHPLFLDPLDPSDAQKDFDNDGRSNLQDYDEFADPTLASLSDPYVDTSTNALHVAILVRTGDKDTFGRTIARIDPGVSINDNGYVAFVGTIKKADNVPRSNIFVVSPGDSAAHPVMGISEIDELPELQGDNDVPAQKFFGAQLNNRNQLVSSRWFNGTFTDISLLPISVSNYRVTLTYVELWDATANGLDPVLVESGIFSDPAVSKPGLLIDSALWIPKSPSRPAIRPGLFDVASPWYAIQARSNTGYPALNDNGQTVFNVLHEPQFQNLVSYVVTPAALTLQTGVKNQDNRARRVRIANDGAIALVAPNGNGRDLILYSYDLKSRKVLASTQNGWNSIGQSPSISDDGSLVAFYGDLGVTGGNSLGMNPGPGVFVAYQKTNAWNVYRLNGVSRNGFLDPGEIDPSNGFALHGDLGLIQGFFLEERCAVGNSGNVAYLAALTNGHQALLVSEFKKQPTSADEQVVPPRVILQSGDNIVNSGTAVKSLSIFDSANNNNPATYAFVAAGVDGIDYLCTAQEGAVLDSWDRMIKGVLRLPVPGAVGLAQAGPPVGQEPVTVTIEHSFVGKVIETQTYTFDGGNGPNSPLVYASLDDAFPDWANGDPRARAQATVFVRKHNPETGHDDMEFYSILASFGDVKLTVTRGSQVFTTTKSLTPIEGVSTLINRADDAIHAFAFVGQGLPVPERQEEKGELSERHLTTKLVAGMWKAGREAVVFGIGTYDGFYECAESLVNEVQTIWNDVAKAVTEAAEGIWHVALYYGKVNLRTFPAEFRNARENLINIWNGFLTETEKKAPKPYLGEGGAGVNYYVGGVVFGRGLCEAAKSIAGTKVITFAKAAAEVAVTSKAARVATKALSDSQAFKAVGSFHAKSWFPHRPDQGAWERILTVLSLEKRASGKTVAEIIEGKLRQPGFEKFDHDVIFKELSAYAQGRVGVFGEGALRRTADLIELLGSEGTPESFVGFLRAYRRLVTDKAEFFRALDAVFKGDKKRLATALAEYANPAGNPDTDLLTLLNCANPQLKVVESLDHPALVAFSKRTSELAIEPADAFRIKPGEGIAGARFEALRGERLSRPPTSDPDAIRRDFEGALYGRVDVKGPILNADGSFIAGAIPEKRVRGLAAAAVEKSKGTFVDTIVVDLFGLNDSQIALVKQLIVDGWSSSSIRLIYQ